MVSLGRKIRYALASNWAAYVAFHTLAANKIKMAALLGMVGFPLFHVFYVYVQPQPYEPASLRFAGFMISAVLALYPWWPARAQPWLPAYSYVAFLLAIPCYFTFMMMMNGGSTVWQLSTLAAFVYIALLYDSVNMIIVTVTGTVLGYLAFALVAGGAPVPDGAWELLPVAAFASFGVALLNYNDNRVAEEKLQAASRLAGQIAHEMRTPLAGITFDAERVDVDIKHLSEIAAWANNNGYTGKRISNRRAVQLQNSMGRIKDHTLYANLVIDMLLMNAGRRRISDTHFEIVSARKSLESALERYHFRPGEREQVSLSPQHDFEFFGSDVLLTHTIFNLLKNALRALGSVEDGRIRIDLEAGETFNRIIVHDNGPGIPPDILSKIFIPFVSGEKHGEGTGIGLAFSKFVVDSFGGSITCTSKIGYGARFELTFPPVTNEQRAQSERALTASGKGKSTPLDAA